MSKMRDLFNNLFTQAVDPDGRVAMTCHPKCYRDRFGNEHHCVTCALSQLPYDGQPPSVASSDTSRAAADSVSESAAAMRAKVYNHVVLAQVWGSTCDEVEEALNMRHQTVSARVRELVLMGLIADSGQRRKTRSGRSAAVWIRRAK
jgi:hypothetical protein